MEEQYSLTMRLEIWNNKTGEKITIGEDRDGLDMLEICVHDAEGKATGEAITLNDEQQSLLIDALQEYRRRQKGKVDDMKRGALATLEVTQEQKGRFPEKDWQYAVANGDTRLGYEEWVRHCVEGQSDERPVT